MDTKLKKITTSAVLAALICAATYVVQIPMYGTNGYVNLGDCFVLIAAWLCGAKFGFASAAVGSALADLISGYAIYAPGTFVIKGAMAAAAAVIAGLFEKHGKTTGHEFSGHLISAIAAEIIMIVGYFLYSWLVFGNPAASAGSIPGNAVQGAVGIVSAIVLYAALERTEAAKAIKFK